MNEHTATALAYGIYRWARAWEVWEARGLMATVQNQWYHFGIGCATHFGTYFSVDWNVPCGNGVLTRGQINPC